MPNGPTESPAVAVHSLTVFDPDELVDVAVVGVGREGRPAILTMVAAWRRGAHAH